MSSLLEMYIQDADERDFAKKLVESWAPKMELASHFRPGMDELQKVKLAIVLENAKRSIVAHERYLHEASQSSDIGPYRKYAYDLITTVMSNLVAEDIVSVQPLKMRVGSIAYMKFTFGSTKGSIAQGSDMLNPFTGNANQYTYSGETVSDEECGSSGGTKYTGNLAWTPVRANSVVFTVGSSVFTDNGSGVLSGAGLSGGVQHIDYSTGAYELNFSAPAGSALTVSYNYNLDFAPTAVPEVNFTISEVTITAVARRLKATYAFGTGYDMMQEYGLDTDVALLETITNEILHEIDGEIMADLWNQAGDSTSWDKQVPDAQIAWVDHKQAFLDHIVATSNKIFANTLRYTGNFLIVGETAANLIESFGAPRWQAATVGIQAGPHFAGILDNKWKVYKDPYYSSEKYLMGFKGGSLLESGYVYAPYLPISTTPIIMREDFTVNRGFATSYGKRMLNNLMYVRGSIIHPTAAPSV